MRIVHTVQNYPDKIIWALLVLVVSAIMLIAPPLISKSEANIVAIVRYLVTDVERSIAFYTKALGFKLEQSMAPAFARVSHNDLTLWLAGPPSSAARPMPDGRRPEPGGWNRFVIEMEDLVSRVAQMKQAGLRFRNDIVVGPGGKQILLDDPDGNVVELFEAAR